MKESATSKLEGKILSASKIDQLDCCSWKYYLTYELKFPRDRSDATDIGSLVHAVFEYLLNKRHRKLFDQIIRRGRLEDCSVVDRYIKGQIKKLNLSKGNYFLIELLIYNGLTANFFCQGFELLKPEHSFEIENKEKGYKVRGVIDKMGVNHENKEVIVWDYKTSKQKFSSEKLLSNWQSVIYTLVAKKMFPGYRCKVCFVFVRMKKSPLQWCPEIPNWKLAEFENALADKQRIIDNFDYENSLENFASDNPFHRFMCGNNTHTGEQDATGAVKWGCFYKFPFQYWSLCSSDGAVIKSSLKESELLPDSGKGEMVLKFEYAGCPKFKHLHKNLTSMRK